MVEKMYIPFPVGGFVFIFWVSALYGIVTLARALRLSGPESKVSKRGYNETVTPKVTKHNCRWYYQSHSRIQSPLTLLACPKARA